MVFGQILAHYKNKEICKSKKSKEEYINLMQHSVQNYKQEWNGISQQINMK